VLQITDYLDYFDTVTAQIQTLSESTDSNGYTSETWANNGSAIQVWKWSNGQNVFSGDDKFSGRKSEQIVIDPRDLTSTLEAVNYRMVIDSENYYFNGSSDVLDQGNLVVVSADKRSDQ
jgi:hypothetical protein